MMVTIGTIPARRAEPSVPTVRLWLAVFAGYLALGATLQLLPVWVTGELHRSVVAAGAAVGLAFVATAAGRPVAGAGADRGHPRRLVVVGASAVLTGSVLSALPAGLPSLLVGRVIMGGGEAFLFGAAIPWVLSVCPSDQRGRASGLFGLSMWGGLALGPVCATVVDALSGPRGVWVLVVGLAVASTVLTLVIRSTSMPAAAVIDEPLSLRALVPRSAVLPGAVFGCAGYGYGAVSAGLVLFMLDHHLAGAAALPTFAAAFLGLRTFGSGLVDRFGATVVAACSLACGAAGAVLVSVSTSTASALVATVLMGAGTSLMFPSTVAWSLARRESGSAAGQGAFIGVSSSFWDLGIAAGGVLTGVAIGSAGYSTAWLISAGVFAVACGVAARSIRRA